MLEGGNRSDSGDMRVTLGNNARECVDRILMSKSPFSPSRTRPPSELGRKVLVITVIASWNVPEASRPVRSEQVESAE